LSEAERVVEARELRQIHALIADAYRDSDGRDKQQLLRLLGGYLLANRSIHLLLQVEEIELVGEGTARVRLFAALAGRPFADLDELFSLRAGLYRFDFELILEDTAWRLIDARWQRASREDFLGS
jgi:hypothetical protein